MTAMTLLTTLWQDLRHAARSLRRTPAFTGAAVITLALGIGANTAIFSLIQAVILRTLPLAAPDEVHFVVHGAGDDMGRSANYRWLERVRARTDVFAGVTAYSHRVFKVASDAGAEQVFGQHVSGNYHGLIGVPIALGRGFVSENDRTPGASPVAVISDGYWSRRFARSPAAIGQTLVVGGHRVTIVGVTTPGFLGMAPGDAVDITLPLSMRLLEEPDFLEWMDAWIGMPILVRLKDGVTVDVASQAVALAYREYMTEPFNADFRLASDGRPTTATLLSAAHGDGDLREEYQTALQVLMGMVGLVLLIACVNVANLFLARGAVRSREVAVRMSVGARRARVLGQFVAEGLVVSVAGGAIGFLLANWGTTLISTLLQAGMEPVLIDTHPDVTVLMFTAGLSLVAGLAFSVAPAWAASRVEPGPTLKDAAAERHTAHRSWQQTLVAAQIALCLVLDFGAGLLMHTLQNLRTVDGGFESDGVVTFALDASDTPVAAERLAPLCAEIIARLDERPDMNGGTCSTMSPISAYTQRRVITVDGVPSAPGEPPTVYANSIDAAYFQTFGMTIVSGRAFDGRDTEASERVAIISETAAERYFGGIDPIGRTFRWGRRDPSAPVTIVGVARDALLTLRDAAPAMIYTPLSQRAFAGDNLLAAVRATGPAPAIAAAIRDAVRASSRDVALTYLRSMDEQIEAVLVSERLLSLLSAVFAGLALLLACVGLYGVTSYEVAQRRREIGVRMALGADRTMVLLGVMRRTALVTVAGLAAGATGALLASQAVAVPVWRRIP